MTTLVEIEGIGGVNAAKLNKTSKRLIDIIAPCFHQSHPTACVTRWWAGRGNAVLTEPT